MERTKGSLILVSIFGVLAFCGISTADDPASKPAPLFCAVGWRGEFTLIRPGVGELPPKRYDLPTHLQALAWSPDGVLYAGREGDLYTLNPWTGDFEHTVSINSDIRGMAFAPWGELYVTSEYTLAQRLRIIDLETGAHREAGVLWGDGQTAQGLAFSPDGVLYAISPKVHVGTYELFTIDLNDAEMHLLGSFSSSANANQSIAFTPDGRLYALGADVLVQLNPADGTIIGSPTRLSGEYRGLELVRGPKTVYYVDDDALGANDGSSWNNAFNNLQDALTAADPYTEIRVAQGIYRPDLGAGITPGDQTATFRLKNNVTIKAGYAGWGMPEPNARAIDEYKTILSGDLNGDDWPDLTNSGENSIHVVTGSRTDATAVLDGFTITAGNATGSFGAGIINEFGSPTVIGCTFVGNAARGGGGMFNISGSPKVINCTFSANIAEWSGGGMFNGEDSFPTVVNCLFARNSSEGAANDIWGGGGMFNDYASPTLTNCTFSENSAYRGGGMLTAYGFSSPVLANCVFWANTAQAGPQIELKYGSVPIVLYSNVQGAWPGAGNIDSDPCFAEPGYWDSNSTWVDGDYHLLPGSPCINAGDPDYVAEPDETDLDGGPRVIGGRIDMGAYEFNHVPVADAGPDETVYAGVDGMAKVTLDGTGSYDEDEQPLTYKWSLKTDGEIAPLPGDGIVNLRDFAALAKKWRGLKKSLGETTPPYGHRQAVLADLSALSDLWLGAPSSPKWNPEYDVAQTGPMPTIELPVGVHVIELIVNDGINDSLPDQVVITVVGPIEACLKIVPQMINRHSQGRHISAHIRLPAGIAEDQIDMSEPLFLYPGSIAASNQRVTHSHSQADVRTSIFARFDKAALMDAVADDGPADLQVVWRLMTGQYYYGCDTVTVIHAP
jgi:hypothetical protein